MRVVSIHLCDTDAPPSMRLGRQSPLARPLRHCGGPRWHGSCSLIVVGMVVGMLEQSFLLSPRRRTMVPASIRWLLGVPRVVVILLGLLGFFSPAMPSDRTIT